MRCDHIKIFQTVYLLTLEAYRMAGNFPREHKYTLGEKIKQSGHELLDLVALANAARDKRETLNQLGIKLESLRVCLRLAFDLKIISPGKLEAFNRQVENIARQISGWQKWASKEKGV
jgi:four helix bundle protein